jgi:two-component system OmpR family sensor kinase
VYGAQGLTKVVQVAQPMRVRQDQAATLALRTLRPFAFLLPVLAILIWLAVGRALVPLQRLTHLVKVRRVNELDPIPDEKLPDEVQPLVGALNDLLGRLNSALHRERAFMMDAAHELRTPLTALHLQMGALARAASDSERAEATEKLSAGVQRAIRLVEQMLALSRQEARTEPARTRVALDELVREVVTELVPLSDAKRIDLGIAHSQEAFVQGDGDALGTLLRNLIDNALRYTPAGGRVDVSVEVVGSNVVLRVVDTGPGIPAEDRDRVFDRFYRATSSRTLPGSGLGLSIVAQIATLHGGTVALDPREGGGTVARLVLPAGADGDVRG